MGNKKSKSSQFEDRNRGNSLEYKIDKTTQEYDIIPKRSKFDKIDLVKYGKIFDAYDYGQRVNNLDAITAIKYAIDNASESYGKPQLNNYGFSYVVNSPNKPKTYDTTLWYLDDNCRKNIMKECEQYQFPLKELLTFCVTYNQNELLEFILTQELIEIDFWCRDYFKCNIFDIICWSSQLMKLSSLNVIASYMIPERVSQEDFKKAIMRAHMSPQEARMGGETVLSQPDYTNENDKKRFINLCKGMVEEGMNGRAQRIIQTRKVLVNNIDDFPKELIGVIIGFAFGMFHKQN